MRRALVLTLVLLGLATQAGAKETNRCVACHETEVLPISLGHSFAEWRGSAHGRAGVGCERCHGGDPAAATPDAAHAGVKPATDPASLVHPTRLPAMCGSCHAKELESFATTVHNRELHEGRPGATCFTCHGAMATGFPTPRELAERCAVCHAKPVGAEAALTMLAATKRQLMRAERAVEATKSGSAAWHETGLRRLHELEHDYRDVQLKWHTFKMREVTDDCRDLLKLAHALDDEASIRRKRSGD